MFNFFSKKHEPQQLFFKTDIHCHVLPRIDDGAQSSAQSVELIEGMQRWGIERIFASPHITFGTFENNAETIAGSFNRLKQVLAEHGNNIFLGHSAENRIDDLFMKNVEQDTLITLPGKRLLIENSFMVEPWNLEQLIFDLQLKQYRPILVHPERYSYYYQHKERYKTLHDAGAAFQVNVLSLAGHYGKEEKKWAEYLIDKGYVDYLGTDLHRPVHIEAIDRYLAGKDYPAHRDALQGRIHNDEI